MGTDREKGGVWRGFFSQRQEGENTDPSLVAEKRRSKEKRQEWEKGQVLFSAALLAQIIRATQLGRVTRGLSRSHQTWSRGGN